MKRFSLSIVLLAGVAAAPALAGPDNACWNRDLERLDFYTNPPEGGDNNFFTTTVNATSSANVSILYMNTLSMGELIYSLTEIRQGYGGPGPTGCQNGFLNGLQYFMPAAGIAPPNANPTYLGPYSASKTYPDPIVTYSAGGQSNIFAAGSAYQYLNWPVGGNTVAAPGAQTPTAACNAATGNDGVATNNCTTCLSTQGYWLNYKVADNNTSTSAAVFTGTWLNFYPPKWVLMNLAYRRLEQNGILNSLRTAVAGVNGLNGAKS